MIVRQGFGGIRASGEARGTRKTMAPVNDNPLGGLIKREIAAHEGLSYRTLAARAPGRLTKSDVSDFVNNQNAFIRPEKLIALADALGKPLAVIVDAALATMGLDAGRTRTVEQAIEADEQLPELAKRQLLQLVERYRQDAVANDEQTAAYNPRFPPGHTDH